MMRKRGKRVGGNCGKRVRERISVKVKKDVKEIGQRSVYVCQNECKRARKRVWGCEVVRL